MFCGLVVSCDLLFVISDNLWFVVSLLHCTVPDVNDRPPACKTNCKQ